MKEINNKNSFYEEPEVKIIYLTESDIITTSGEPLDYETELIQY